MARIHPLDDPIYIELLSQVELEVLARGKLKLSAVVRLNLIRTVVDEVLEAHDNGWEFVGAQGGLQYDPITKEWS